MFESIEIRRVSNGFILVVHSEDDDREFVYDTSRRLMRAVKQYIEGPNSKESED
jgi:GTP cyclohydrolase I